MMPAYMLLRNSERSMVNSPAAEEAEAELLVLVVLPLRLERAVAHPHRAVADVQDPGGLVPEEEGPFELRFSAFVHPQSEGAVVEERAVPGDERALHAGAEALRFHQVRDRLAEDAAICFERGRRHRR